MKTPFISFFMLLSMSFSAVAYSEVDLQLPFENSFYASSTYATLSPENSGKRHAFIMKPERRDLNDPLIKGRHGFEYYFYKNKEGSPLVLLLGGFGSLSSSGPLKFLAEKLWQQGYHVATIHSVISWKFVLSASSTGVFGWGPNDARDVYKALLASLIHIDRHTSFDEEDISLVGLSLGGLSIAHVMNLDQSRQTFKKGIMINPPVDVHYTLSVVDSWHAIGDNWSPEKRNSVIGYLLGVGAEVSEKLKRDPSFLSRLEKEVKVPIRGLKYLIGYQFRDSLGSAIQVGQSINDNGILPGVKSKASSLRFYAARKFSFGRYMREVSIPFWTQEGKFRKSPSLKTFLASSDLSAADIDPRTYILHSVDDPLINSKDIQFMRSQYRGQFTLFSGGGHLGNLWHPLFLEELFVRLSVR